MLRATNPLIREFGPKEDLVEAEVTALWKQPDESRFLPLASKFAEDSIVKGKVVSANKDRLIVDFGAKTVGVVDGHEFEDGNYPKVGEEITVLIEELENEDGLIGLSKRKADKRSTGRPWSPSTRKATWSTVRSSRRSRAAC